MNKIKKYPTGHVLYELAEEERFVFGSPYILLDAELRKIDDVEYVSEYIRNEIWRFNPFCETVREADLTVEAVHYRNQLESLRQEMDKSFKLLTTNARYAEAVAAHIRDDATVSIHQGNVGKKVTTMKNHGDLGGVIPAGRNVEIIGVSQHGYTIRDVETGTTVRDIGFLV